MYGIVCCTGVTENRFGEVNIVRIDKSSSVTLDYPPILSYIRHHDYPRRIEGETSVKVDKYSDCFQEAAYNDEQLAD